MTHYTPRLLLVEDDPQDAFLVGRYLSDLPMAGRFRKWTPCITPALNSSRAPTLLA